MTFALIATSTYYTAFIRRQSVLSQLFLVCMYVGRHSVLLFLLGQLKGTTRLFLVVDTQVGKADFTFEWVATFPCVGHHITYGMVIPRDQGHLIIKALPLIVAKGSGSIISCSTIPHLTTSLSSPSYPHVLRALMTPTLEMQLYRIHY